MAEDSEKATNYILGFIIGVFAFGVVGMFTQGLQGMARTGVLEQLCMSPHGLIVNFLARAAVGSVTTVVSSSIMVWLVTFTLGGSLHFTAVPVFVLLILTFANLLGFGFMVGGLVLVFKQVGQVAIIVRLVLFLIAVTASEELLNKGWALAGIMHALPVTDAAICIKAVLIDDLGYGIFQHNSFYWLMASCVVWTSLGLVTFKFMENWSRSKGTLGAY
jgi:ABC-type polysaccharide/polyol phosphate export permease